MLYSAGVGASGNNLLPLGPPSCSTGIGVAGTDARVISKITGHLVALTGIGAAPVTEIETSGRGFCRMPSRAQGIRPEASVEQISKQLGIG